MKIDKINTDKIIEIAFLRMLFLILLYLNKQLILFLLS